MHRQAVLLAKSLRSLTLRLVDPLHCPELEVNQAVALAIPLLLEQVGRPNEIR